MMYWPLFVVSVYQYRSFHHKAVERKHNFLIIRELHFEVIGSSFINDAVANMKYQLCFDQLFENDGIFHPLITVHKLMLNVHKFLSSFAMKRSSRQKRNFKTG